MKKYAKKYALIFILIAFAITMALWPLVIKRPISTAHENPGTAQTSFNVSMTNMLDYSDIVGALATGGSVQDLIDNMDLGDIPADMQFIMQTYNDLLIDLKTKLDNLDIVLDEIELLLGQSEFDETSLKLTDAEYLVVDIGFSLGDMDNANQQIKSILGSYTPTKQIDVANELRARLLDDMETLETLRAAYEESAPQKIATGLILLVPEQIYPGLPYKIRGQITYDSDIPSIERDVKLLWDNEPIDTVYSYRDQSAFEIEVTPDENTMLGKHTLKVVIEAKDQYGSTSDNVTLIVTKEFPEIKIEELSYSILYRNVQVRGKVDSETPLQEAIVIIELKGTTTSVSTSPDGEFEALLDLPLGLVNIGEEEMKVRFESSEIWQSSTEVTAEIFILDIFSLGFISAAFITIGMIVYVARRGSLGKGGGGVLEIPALQESTQQYTNTFTFPVGFAEEELEGTGGQILKAYAEAMKMVGNVSGVAMEPNMTLREYLKETTPKLNGAIEAFTELTHSAEEALYSPRITGLEDIERAEKLLVTVKGILMS